VKAQEGDDKRWWLAAGAIAGFAFLAKYAVALYVVSIAAGLLATTERRLLATWAPWAGALVALAVAAPNLIWQAANGWPFVAHTAVLAAEKNIPLSPGQFLVQEILVLGAATAPVWIARPAAFAFRSAFAQWRWIAVSWLLLVAAAVIGRGRPYYIAPAYPLLMAGGAVALARPEYLRTA
jgi:4-amino-4-deoxy-L-arabinose transferase-like glycosyltransferase